MEEKDPLSIDELIFNALKAENQLKNSMKSAFAVMKMDYKE